MRTITILLSFCLLTRVFGQGYKPEKGYLPDSKIAVRIAETVFAPVYGEEQVESERPFSATLKHDVWTVTGALYCGTKTRQTTDCDGGVAEVRISRDDARILYMWHGK